jgi:DNA modification methylase
LKLELHYRPVDALLPYARNARTHSEAQIAQIAASIAEFGWTNPILVDGQNGVVAGHGRISAARKLGLTEVPVIELAHLSPTQRRAYVLNDNQLALNAGWNEELLALELQELQDAGFDLTLTGFDADELADLLAGDEPTEEGQTDDDAAPEVQTQSVSQVGDVWLMGSHRLLCGDATQSASYQTLLGDGSVDMIFCDPPYGVNYSGSVTDKQTGRDRSILNDNLGGGFYDFLLAAFKPMLMRCAGAIYIAMSSSELDTLQAAFRAAGGHWSTFVIWAKNTFTLGRSDYQRQYEPMLYGWREGASHHWCGDRDQGDVWQIKKPHRNDLHPCLCPGSEVLTHKGWRAIESLLAGERVLTADGVFRPVELVSNHFIETSVFRIFVRGVESAVDATGNHPFLVFRDNSLAWIEASQIIEGDEICSPEKATLENSMGIDYEWNTTSCGNDTLVPSQTDIASIMSTTTSKIITFQTCNLSPTLSTSGFTAVVSCAMAFGGSAVVSAGHLNRSHPNTGISAQKATPTGGGVVRVMSNKSYSFVLRSVNAIKQINYSGLVWNLSVKDSPTFETRIGMSHNTMKPVELVERALRNSSRPGDVVLDPFGGSGTTLIAAHKSGRVARLMELDPQYADVIVRRWQAFSGELAVREVGEVLFDDLAAESCKAQAVSSA